MFCKGTAEMASLIEKHLKTPKTCWCKDWNWPYVMGQQNFLFKLIMGIKLETRQIYANDTFTRNELE